MLFRIWDPWCGWIRPTVGEFMVIEAGDQASVCLNLTDELVLTNSKTLPRFAVIKVMNNRMQARVRAQTQYREVG